MNNIKFITLRLRESEGDIICWIKSLPNYTITKYINHIFAAESKRETASIPCNYLYNGCIEKWSCVIKIKDPSAIDFIERIPKGKINTTLIKIIRKHIRKNRKKSEEPFHINGELLASTLDGLEKEMNLKEKEYRFSRKKYEKYCNAYDIAKHEIRDAVHRCYKSVDENTGDYNLKHLDYLGIAEEAFEMSFGYVLPKWMRIILRKL